jgi:hypothetical protein
MDNNNAEITRDLRLTVNASVSKFEDLEIADKVKNALKIPEEKERQPDLSYMSAILVSSGMNLNGAFFLPSELLGAFNSVANKPLDIEHDELGIVGHLTQAVIVDREGNVLDIGELEEKGQEELDNSDDMDIVVTGIIYKDRFPEIAGDVM